VHLVFMSTNVERNVFNVRYTEFPDKNYCTVVLFDALPLKSTRSYTCCTWSCSERTDCVKMPTRPRKLRTKVWTGSYWIHTLRVGIWKLPNVSYHHLPHDDYVSLGAWKRALRYGAIKNTQNVWNTNYYHKQL